MPDCPIYILSSSKDPNIPYFEALAAKSGGYYLGDISSRMQTNLKLSLAPNVRILKSNLENPYLFGSYRYGSIIAPLNRSGNKAEFILQNSDGKRVLIERDLTGLKRVQNPAPGTLWASMEAENLRARGKTAQEIINFSRPYSLAGAESSLIVLEEPIDYITADIPVPATYPAELRADYEEELAWFNEERADDYEYRFEELVEIWGEQVEWWDKKYKFEAKKEDTRSDDDEIVVTGSRIRREAPPVIQSYESSDGTHDSGFLADVGPEAEIVVTASKRADSISIEIREWTPDRPYLAAMADAHKKDRYATYVAQQNQFGDLPAFYLEMADFYDRADDQRRAAQILLGALELESANAETYTQVAHRLLAYEEYDRAIELYRYVLEIAPNLPQSYLNLAVALHDRGLETRGRKAQKDFLEAVSLLETIILTPWLFDDEGDYEGIEIVAMMEANAIIPRIDHEERDNISYPEELIKKLDVDHRVVMDWNVDHADMDLWVYEPTGESASFGFQLTGIGGQLSNDMTDGYGPEQYLLRRAVKGDYEIRTDFFSASEYNPNGAVSIRVRMTKNFARDNQSTETVIVELSDDEDEDEFVVGSFSVK